MQKASGIVSRVSGEERTMREVEKLRLAVMDQVEVAHIQGFLERAGCSMTYMSAGYYLVSFPEGTTEDRPADPRPQFQDETRITLPNGLTITKVVHWPCTRPMCNHVRLLLPGEEGENRRRRYA
jgi:hypothetical protein